MKEDGERGNDWRVRVRDKVEKGEGERVEGKKDRIGRGWREEKRMEEIGIYGEKREGKRGVERGGVWAEGKRDQHRLIESNVTMYLYQFLKRQLLKL